MTELGQLVPTRNILTGAVVNWSEAETGVGADDETEDKIDGLTLAWRDLCVYRKKRTSRGIWRSSRYEEVKVLHGVSGVVTQGNLVAIMGSSGAGKTTLLAAISRRDKSDTTGSLTLNGGPASCRLLANISGFVPQQDLAIGDLSVAEHMAFMARLLMDRRSTASARARTVQHLLSDLNVAACVDTKLDALSGGERKRISLAVQLLNDPPLLFCDEPTTGLDSWAASAVTSRLRSLAAAGKLVVCSIHQPASGVFEMFHQVIFLAGGRVAFQGTIDQAANFFTGLGFRCPVGFNQAEYYVSRLGVEGGRERESNDRIRRICDEFRRSKMAAAIERELELSDPFERYLTLKKVSCCVQFYWLMWRNVAELRRNYTLYLAEIVLFMGVGLTLAIPYMSVTSTHDQRDIQNLEGLLYLIVTQTVFTFIYSVFNTFPLEMPVLLRETANGLYSPAPYYLSKMIFWIPRAVVVPALFSSLIFFLVGLGGGAAGWAGITFVCILCANVSNAYGSYLSATFESIETAALVSVPMDLMGTMFSGVYLNLASLPPLVAWIKYLSPFYYGTEAVSVMQWGLITDIKCVDAPGLPCIRTGADVLVRFGYAADNLWIDMLGLCVMYSGFHLIAYLMLCRRSRRAPVY